MPDRWFDGTYYKRELTINYLDCNTERKVFPHYILGVFSEIAGDESQAKGRTHEVLVSSGRVFMITRMSLRLHRTPCVNETLIFRTWFRKAEGKFFLRDGDVRSPEGQLIASISGTWVYIDLFEHRVLDSSEHPVDPSRRFDEAADAPECKKIVSETELPLIGQRPVYYTDLDCNCHVNNSAYSRIALDFLPEEYRDREIEDFIINFNKETRLGDTLEIRGGPTENGFIVQGFNDKLQHFAGEFIFRRH